MGSLFQTFLVRNAGWTSGRKHGVACTIDGQPDSNLSRQKCRLNIGAQTWVACTVNGPTESNLPWHKGRLDMGRNKGCVCDRWATSIKSSSAEMPIAFGHATWVACAINEQTDSNLSWQKCRLNIGAQTWGCLYDRWATWFKPFSAEMSVKYWGANMGCLYSKWANWIKSSLAQRPVGYGTQQGLRVR